MAAPRHEAQSNVGRRSSRQSGIDGRFDSGSVRLAKTIAQMRQRDRAFSMHSDQLGDNGDRNFLGGGRAHLQTDGRENTVKLR